ncbi:hypothetical protein HAX54_019176, partial [Datura stramonium]|nr:hypothetical protein [Datura stramonium]
DGPSIDNLIKSWNNGISKVWSEVKATFPKDKRIVAAPPARYLKNIFMDVNEEDDYVSMILPSAQASVHGHQLKWKTHFWALETFAALLLPKSCHQYHVACATTLRRQCLVPANVHKKAHIAPAHAQELGRVLPANAQGSWAPRTWPCTIVAARRTQGFPGNSEPSNDSLDDPMGHPEWLLNGVQKRFRSISVIVKGCNDLWWKVMTCGIDPLEGLQKL